MEQSSGEYRNGLPLHCSNLAKYLFDGVLVRENQNRRPEIRCWLLTRFAASQHIERVSQKRVLQSVQEHRFNRCAQRLCVVAQIQLLGWWRLTVVLCVLCKGKNQFDYHLALDLAPSLIRTVALTSLLTICHIVCVLFELVLYLFSVFRECLQYCLFYHVLAIVEIRLHNAPKKRLHCTWARRAKEIEFELILKF